MAIPKFLKPFLTKEALVGLAITFHQKIWRVVELGGDVDFIAAYADKAWAFVGKAWTFFSVDWGTWLVVAFGLGLVLHSYYRHSKRPEEKPAEEEKPFASERQYARSVEGEGSPTEQSEQTDGEVHERLELFLIDHIKLACSAQVSLQEEILKLLCDNENVVFLAGRGLINNYKNWQFCKSYEDVIDLGNSPMPVMTNGEMVECIVGLENHSYRAFCEQADELSKSGNIDYRDHPVLGPLWEKWRLAHNALVEEYDRLKRESRLGRPLYRPARESRWGGMIQPIGSSD